MYKAVNTDLYFWQVKRSLAASNQISLKEAEERFRGVHGPQQVRRVVLKTANFALNMFRYKSAKRKPNHFVLAGR